MVSIPAIAQAVADAIAAAPLSQPAIVVRSYQPSFELHELHQTHIAVVPKAISLTQMSRRSEAREVQIDVGVLRKLDQVDSTTIDPLVALVDELADLFWRQRLPGVSGVVWAKSAIDPIFAPEHLRELRQFTAVLTLTFRVLE